MRIFLIDFENVHSEGLAGVDFLNENDEVVIFHSNNADTITFEMMHKLMFSKAKLSYYKVRRGGRNALDFQMSSFLGYLVNSHGSLEAVEFFLISKDNGFDFVIDFWESGNINIKPKIKRFYTIKAAFAQPKPAVQKQPVSVPPPVVEIPPVVADDLPAAVEELLVTAESPAPPVPTVPPPPPKKKPAPKKPAPEKPAPGKKPVTVEESPKAVEQVPVVDENESAIEQLLAESLSSHELYIGTVKRFGQKKGVEIYREIKGRFSVKK